MPKAHDPITPGEILLTEFLEPLGITQYRLARATGLPQTRISEIVRGKRSITTDTALRLSKALGVDDRFWINIQTDYDLEVERDHHSHELAQVTQERWNPRPDPGENATTNTRPPGSSVSSGPPVA